MLKLYNTLTRKKENFKPLKDKNVGMYSCGPTVYNYAHIGNLRTYLFNDFLKRSLEFLDYKVNQVMNITDVDDKTIRESQKNKSSLSVFTKKYEKIFFNDLKELNIQKPTHTLRATENIPEMIKIIEKLLKKNIAYKTEDGIYFNIEKTKNYGKLALLDKTKKTKSRIKNDEYDKKTKSDFALWKFHTKSDGENKWKAPFGEGRPGWHIECSAMSMKVLGNTFDIHTGGSDLIFPHHTNEIAQSEAVSGKKFVKYWLHAGFLIMSEGKMSKSIGNVLTLKTLNEKGFSPLDYRYLALTTHYREQLIFSIKNLESSKITLQRAKNICADLPKEKGVNKKYIDDFTKALEDDLNLPKALQVMWKLLRDKTAKGKYQTIKKMDEVLGLDLLKETKVSIPKNIKELLKERETARKNKNYKESDKLREEIQKLGYKIDDTTKGTKVTKA